jgi:hypothetical protein
MKKTTVKENITQHRHRLQDVEERDEDEFGAPAFGRERPISDGKEERRDHCRQHAQGRAQRVFRQIDRIEGDDRLFERRERSQGFASAFGRKQQQPQHQRKCNDVPPVRDQTACGQAGIADCASLH